MLKSELPSRQSYLVVGRVEILVLGMPFGTPPAAESPNICKMHINKTLNIGNYCCKVVE